MFKKSIQQLQLYYFMKHIQECDQSLRMRIHLMDAGDKRYFLLYPVDLKLFIESLCEAEEMDTLKIFRRRISNYTKNYLYYLEQFKILVERHNNEEKAD